MKNWPSLIWHAPGRVWAGMIAAAPVTTWLTAGAAMAWTVVSVGFVLAFRADLAPDHLFWIAMTALGIVFVAIVAQTGLEISVSASRGGVNANLGRDDVKPVALVTTTTTVTAPADPAERSLEDPA